MKLEKLFAVSIAAALAAAATGCRYNKPANGADGADGADGANPAGAVDVAGGQDEDPNVDTLITDPNALDDGTLASALEKGSGLPFDQDPSFKPVDGADFAPVYFGFDSTTIPDGEIAKIEDVAKDMAANPTHVAIVAGHCDERGSNEYNLSLGENRAIIVRDYLARLGVEANRLQTKSYGEEKPAVMGSGEAVWSKNRRADFELFETK